MLTFAIKEISEDILEKKDIDALNEAFAKVIAEADLTKQMSGRLTPKLHNTTSDAIEILQQAAMKLEDHFNEVSFSRSQSYIRADKSVKEILLSGSKVIEFGSFITMHLYMRTNDKRKWFRFIAYPKADRLKVITDGFGLVASSLKTIRKHMKKLTVFLERQDSCCHLTLPSSTDKMFSELNKMLLEKTESLQQSILGAGSTIRKSSYVVYSLKRNVQKLDFQIQEIEAMTKLCHLFVRDGLQIPLQPYTNALIEPIYLESVYNYGDNGFEVDDFLKTGYPDVLRKVPVIVNQSELCLHKGMFLTRQSLAAAAAAGRNRVKESFVVDFDDSEKP